MYYLFIRQWIFAYQLEWKVNHHVFLLGVSILPLSMIFLLDCGTFFDSMIFFCFYTPTPQRGRGVYCCTSVRLSVQDIFRHIFLNNCWWQKSNIWSQASYRYTILWVAFLDPSDSYFLFVDLVGFYTHWTYLYMPIFSHIFLSNY
jgi:hypothetical protein